jgi:uncharacterized protein (DUF433 family)
LFVGNVLICVRPDGCRPLLPNPRAPRTSSPLPLGSMTPSRNRTRECFVSLRCDRIGVKMSIGTTATTQTIPLVRHESGVIRVGGTRVSLDSVLYAFLDGSTPEEIVQQYPSLRLADVYTIIAYYLQNRAELDGYLSDRKEQRAKLHKELELRHDLVGIRDRLLARGSKSPRLP